MKEYQIHLNAMGFSRNSYDWMIERLLIALLAFMPLAFGAVEAWSEVIVMILVAAISICFLLKLVAEREVRPVWSWAYAPVLLFLVVVIFQLIPLKTMSISRKTSERLY